MISGTKSAESLAANANTCMTNGQYECAIADLDQAIELDPKNATYLLNRGIAHAQNGEFDNAIADYSESIRLSPRNAVAFFR
jgi:Flp pilus assembly protein TadD